MTDIVREFIHRTYGNIGRVVMAADVKEVKINGKVLPESSVEYLLNFALQSLQDAYAGSDNPAEAKGAFDTKLDKLLAGTMGTRTGGSGVTEEVRIARTIVKAMLLKQLTGDELATFKELKDAALDARLDEVYTKNEAKIKPAVEERIKELAAERARKAKLADKIGGLEL
jgi:hypothetical protein